MPFPEAEKNTSSIYPKSEFGSEEIFAEAFIALGGKFIFCENEQDLMDNINILYENSGWKQLLCSDERLLKLFHNNKIDILMPADASRKC